VGSFGLFGIVIDNGDDRSVMGEKAENEEKCEGTNGEAGLTTERHRRMTRTCAIRIELGTTKEEAFVCEEDRARSGIKVRGGRLCEDGLGGECYHNLWYSYMGVLRKIIPKRSCLILLGSCLYF